MRIAVNHAVPQGSRHERPNPRRRSTREQRHRSLQSAAEMPAATASCTHAHLAHAADIQVFIHHETVVQNSCTLVGSEPGSVQVSIAGKVLNRSRPQGRATDMSLDSLSRWKSPHDSDHIPLYSQRPKATTAVGQELPRAGGAPIPRRASPRISACLLPSANGFGARTNPPFRWNSTLFDGWAKVALKTLHSTH